MVQLSFILDSYLIWRFMMKKNSGKSKSVARKSLWATARSALVHVFVIGIVSLAGHTATNALSASVGALGSAIVPPLAGMFLI
jgi:cytochrome c oxidase assembly factor CtaG